MRELSLPRQLLMQSFKSQTPLASQTRMAGRLNRLGLYMLLALLCCAFFYFLMGHIYPALLAGAALSTLVIYTIRLGEKKTLARRETALRRQIGGEMAVDSLLLQSRRSATSNVTAWLTQVLALDSFQEKANGTIAAHESGRIFITCLQKHPSSKADEDDILCAVRHARREAADICIVCATCDFSAQAAQYAEDLSPRTRLLGRSGLISMAGVAAPADDEQLRTLGKQRRQKFRREVWQARLFDPAKKRRYMLYGVGLSLMYIFTRQVIYIIPALVCLALFGLCRRKKSARFTL